MSTLNATENYSDGNTLTQAQLNTMVSSIETWANGNIDSTNIAAGGVTTACLDTGAVSAAKLAADAVTTAKILDANVTAAKLASDSVTTAKILDANVTAAKLASDSVTTAKILDANVTEPKIAASNYVLSSSCGTYSSSSSSFGTVTNLSNSITTAASRPVYISLVPADGSSSNAIRVGSTGTSDTLTWIIRRDTTAIAEGIIANNSATIFWFPVSSIQTIDVAQTAASHTYDVQVKGSGATSYVVFGAKLMTWQPNA